MRNEPNETPWAGAHVERLSGLDFFPTTKAAIKELRIALERCANEAMARGIVDEWIARNTMAPKPSQLRELVHQANESYRNAQNKLPDCAACDGAGQETRYFLVTYWGNSFRFKRRERLPCNLQSLIEMRALVTTNPAAGSNMDAQEVLSGALKCAACDGSGKRRYAA